MLNRQVVAGFATATAIIALMAGMPDAKAQTANSNSESNAGAASQSSSGARSNANNAGNRQNITFNSPGETTSRNTNTNNSTSNNRDAVSYSGGTNNTTSNYNSGDQTLRTTPTVYAPPVSGGNPCTLAVSGGVSVIGWGAAAGGTFVDQDCANRQKIAMMHNAGYAQAAKELMCNDRDSYFAFRTAGTPCAYRAAFEGNMAPPAAAQPLPVAAPVPAPAPVVMSAPARPAQLPRCKGPNDQGPCYSG